MAHPLAHSSQTASLIVILTLLVAAASVNYAPAPQVNTSSVLVLINSTVGSRFIGSKRLESLRMTYASGSTTFSIRFFNRSSANNMDEYSVTQVGTWIHLTSTTETLSCNLVYEATTQTFGFLQFLNDVGSLKMYATVTLDSVNAALSAPNNSSDYIAIFNNIFLGSGCSFCQLFGTLFKVSSTGQTLTSIAIPQNGTVQATTESYSYLVSNNALYRYNQAQSKYDQIYSFSTFTSYALYQYQNRLIVSASSIVPDPSVAIGNFRVNQSIYCLDSVATTPKLIGRLDFDGYSTMNSVDLYVSPRLTKLNIAYVPLGNSTITFVAKSIDYHSSKIVDLVWKDLARYMLINTNASLSQVHLSDFFLVIRNASGKVQDASLPAFEEVYQFVGNQVVFFRARELTSSSEYTDWSRIQVDLYYDSTLVVLNSFRYSSGYEVYQSEYGNYAATKRIIASGSRPAFIEFTDPDNNNIVKTTPVPTWTFYKMGTNTNLTIHWYNPSSPGNIQTFTDTIAGWIIPKAVSSPNDMNCKILSDSITNTYYLYQFNKNNNSMVLSDPINSAFSVLGPTFNLYSSAWTISSNCDRFSVAKKLFRKVNNTFELVDNDFNWNFIDQTLTYLTLGKAIWKFDSAQGKYVLYRNITTPYIVTGIRTLQNKVIVISSNSSYALDTLVGLMMMVFLDENGNLTLFFNETITAQYFYPVKYSQLLTKVGIVGITSNKLVMNQYHINFTTKQVTPISIPAQILDWTPAYCAVNVHDQYIHVRQTADPTNPSKTPRELVWSIGKDLQPQLVATRNVTFAETEIFQRNLILQKEADSYLMIQTYNSTTKKNTVTAIQLTTKQSALGNFLNKAINGYASGSTYSLCSPGCNECSESVCTKCVTGYVLEPNSALCKVCGPGCTACNAVVPTTCSSCYTGMFLSGTVCLPCNPSCVNCTGTATNCLSCTPGYFFDGSTTTCKACSRNCITCSSDTTCTLCRKGFVVTPSGTCRGCSLSCSSCSAGNITQCTSCDNGLQLVGGQCTQCPANCLTCSGSTCQTCALGYSPNSAGVCVFSCQLPCATCAENQPQVCLTCFASSILSGNTCVIDTSCNSNSSCTDCGTGLGYYLFESMCYPCSSIVTIPNCLQCSQSHQQLCSLCQDGYYLSSSGTCIACPSTCKTCVDSSVCTSCNSSYTLPSGLSQGQCIACKSPCATCSGEPTYCLTCVDGFTKRAWKCHNNTFVNFTLTLSGAGVDVAQVLGNIDALVTSLLTCMGENTTNVDAITFTNITLGSVVVSGSAAPTSGDTSTALTGLSTGVSSGTIAGYTITSSSVATGSSGGSISSGSSDSSNSINKELIIGISVGVAVFIAIIIISIVCVYKYRKNDVNRVADATPYRGRNQSANTSYESSSIRVPPSREKIIVEQLSIKNQKA